MQDFELSVAKDAMVSSGATAAATWLRVLDGTDVLGWISTAAVTGPMRAGDAMKSAGSFIRARDHDQAGAALRRLRPEAASRSVAVVLWPTVDPMAPPCPDCHLPAHPGEPCPI